MLCGRVASVRSTQPLEAKGLQRLAEAGATEWKTTSYLAHKDTKTASVYAHKANRGKLPDR